MDQKGKKNDGLGKRLRLDVHGRGRRGKIIIRRKSEFFWFGGRNAIHNSTTGDTSTRGSS
jgi:hypothetical protein